MANTAWKLALTAALFGLIAGGVRAQETDESPTATFERDYLRFIIDHHYGALRATELAAGTDPTRDAALGEKEGTAPTPETSATEAKAEMDEVFSMARRNNRVQREEILQAQRMLRRWYGEEHQPALTAEDQAMISMLEEAPRGREFDRAFLEMFATHHAPVTHRSLDCLLSRDLEHQELRRFCENVLTTQVNEIEDMREHLCSSFGACEVVPGGSH